MPFNTLMPSHAHPPNHHFSKTILRWYERFGRHDLPWQNTQNPYRIWVSEIMLQQTQVKTVIPFYQRFMSKFPDIKSLASANQDEVLHHWTGLGYYARARNLHKAAQIITSEHNGVFPTEFNDVLELSGIGRSTAGAILSFAFSQRHPILDGNVKRVLSRYFGIEGWPGKRSVSDQLWEIAEDCTPNKQVAKYTQAIMDFGATLCSRSKPKCEACPFAESCIALQTNQVKNLPSKKPKTALPTKKTGLLVIKNSQNQFLLIQRPPTGIWGGLWSFPELESLHLDKIHEQEIFHFNLAKVLVEKIGADFTHTFSHFHLEITPVYASCENPLIDRISEKTAVWYDPKEPLQIGLAAPIKQLLQSV